jgi:class 3 adenylate cyclase/two-component SAPR family response regulator
MFQHPDIAMRLAEERRRDLLLSATDASRRAVRARAAGDSQNDLGPKLSVKLLGPFSVTTGYVTAGPWSRPPAKHICQLVFVSPGRCITRDAVCEELFPSLSPAQAAKALSKALSLARSALSRLGDGAPRLLQADRTNIWADPGVAHEVDLDAHDQALRSALQAEPGSERDQLLTLALVSRGTLLEDEPYADWAAAPREQLDWLRQEARLALARDRAGGLGRSDPGAVTAAWEDCLAYDHTCEEAALALMRAYAAQKRQALVESTYSRCRYALEDLGLHISSALEEFHEAATLPLLGPPARERAVTSSMQERRVVTVLFAEVSPPPHACQLGLETLSDLVGGALVNVVTEVEALGGTVTAVSGTGVTALFGAPECHEDDSERALRAAFNAISSATSAAGASLRAGVETGPAIVGTVAGGPSGHYGAIGEVVGAAAALQSVAQPGSVLVGPATRAATEELFEWGPSEEVVSSTGAKPLRASYLQRPRVRLSCSGGQDRLRLEPALVGREAEVAVLGEALAEVTSGHGGVVIISGEAGLGKTRLVEESRKLFMDWVRSCPERLPLWLEGRAASYASVTPYGLYQRVLSAWVGIGPEAFEETAASQIERALSASLGPGAQPEHVAALKRLMSSRTGKREPASSWRGPAQFERAVREAVKSMVSHLIAHGPTILVLEDLQWADKPSLRLTQELASSANERPLLLVLTRRLEPKPEEAILATTDDANAKPRIWAVQLTCLADNKGRELARAFLGGGDDEVVSALCEGTGNNPLFIAERAASWSSGKVIVKAEGRWPVVGETSGLISDRVRRLVRSRLDRLSQAQRDLLVAGAVLGPEFTMEEVDTVTDLSTDIMSVLHELCVLGLLVAATGRSHSTFSFRYPIVRDVVYEGLLERHRRQLNLRTTGKASLGAA